MTFLQAQPPDIILEGILYANRMSLEGLMENHEEILKVNGYIDKPLLVEEEQVLRTAINIKYTPFSDLANLKPDWFTPGLPRITSDMVTLTLLYDYDQTYKVLTAAESTSVQRNLRVYSMELARRLEGNIFHSGADDVSPGREHMRKIESFMSNEIN